MRWVVLLGLLGAVAAGCSDTECGPGTVVREGRCVAADVVNEIDDCSCGQFTHMDLTFGRCELDYPARRCGEGTEECTNDAGVVVCVVCPVPWEGCE